MSDGLKIIAAAIVAASAGTLIDLDVSMFTQEERPVLDFVRQHVRAYRELPALETVRAETSVRLPSVPEPLDYYLDQVYVRHEYNLIREQFGGLREAISTKNMQEAGRRIAAMSRATRLQHRRGREVMRIDDAMQLVVDRLQVTRGTGGITGIEAGWPIYDSITGGYQRGDLISLVGRPSLGKTYIALRQAFKAHEAGHNVLFVTTEMGIEQIARRYASITLGINPRVLKTNMLSTHMERRLRDFYRDMAGADRFQIFSVGMNSKVAAIEAFVQEFGPSVVFIDGVYLLKPNDISKSANRTERMSAVFDELKALTLDADRPFIVTSQFSRQAGKGGKEGSLENIGFTDAIGTHSSIVVGIKYGPTERPGESRYLEFLKGREGESGEIAINFKFAPLDMNEFTPEERAEATQEESLDWMH